MKITVRFFGVLFLSLSVITHFQAAKAKAATFAVTNLNDGGAGSLRQAIMDANASAGADTIEFQVAGTVNLLSALPDLSSDITINGISADSSIVRRGSTDAFRIFTVTSGVNVRLNNLTIQNGSPRGNGSEDAFSIGGGILNDVSNLTVFNCKILDNTVASGGGGIFNRSGTVNIEKTVFSNNRTSNSAPNCPTCYANGASIYNTGNMSIKDSDVSNSVGSEAIYNYTNATILDSKIANNEKGGIYNRGTLILKKNSIVNNSSTGLVLFIGFGIIENNTISGNNSVGYAGGITLISSAAQITNNTIIENRGNSAGGIYIQLCQSPCVITNNIVADNTAASTSTNNFSSSRGNYGGSYNLIENGAGSGFVNGVNGNIVGTADAPIDPQLSPLGDYGGRTPTRKLLPTSPAINAASPTDFLLTDQRGVPRLIGGRADIGAVEFNLTPHRFLPKGGLNANYEQVLTAFADNPAATFIFTISNGSLPPGLSLVRQSDATAVIRGVPLQTGTYNFTITATNANNFTASASYNLTIQNEVFFVAVGGKVSFAEGRGIARAFVQLIDANGNVIKQTPTNPFGFYRFKDIQSEENYIFRVVSKNRRIAERVIEINGALNDLNFTAEPLPSNLLK